MGDNERLNLMVKIQDFIKKKNEMFDKLHIDFGYSLENLANGFIGEPLIQVPGDKMRGFGFPQLSVAIDLYGDVFLFREAGFLNREGNKKFIIGRISPDDSVEEIIKNFDKENDKICKFLNINLKFEIEKKKYFEFNLEKSKKNIYKSKKYLSKKELSKIEKQLKNYLQW